jgi:hypothetical protein
MYYNQSNLLRTTNISFSFLLLLLFSFFFFGIRNNLFKQAVQNKKEQRTRETPEKNPVGKSFAYFTSKLKYICIRAKRVMK